MRLLNLLFVTLFITAPAFAQMVPGPREALDGIDPVALLTTGKEVSGKAEFKVSRGTFDYLFASADNKAAFEKAPAKYEIQLNGACARMGGGVTGNPADYAVVDGKIYIFGSDDCHKKFVAAPAKFLPRKEVPMPASPADAQAGRALLDKALNSIGGAARIAAVSAYSEVATQTQKRPSGDARITVKTTRRFPDAVRVDRATKTAERSQESANLILASGGWFMAQGRTYPQSQEGRAASLREYDRQLLTLLRAHRSPEMKVAALPAATIEGTLVDRVRLNNGSLDVTLNLSRDSGQIHSMSYVGRNIDAAIGDVTILFSDFRDVKGLRLPFAETALFDGQPEPLLSRTIESFEVNPAIDAAFFQPPASGGQ
jgi:YHS domain-containing protein